MSTAAWMFGRSERRRRPWARRRMSSRQRYTDKTRDLQGTWAQAVPGDAGTQRTALGGALQRGDKGLIAAISANATVLTVDDHKAVAGGSEALFITEILPGQKKKNEFHKIMADAEIRASLKEEAPDEWEALVDTTPMLKLLENVEKSFAPARCRWPRGAASRAVPGR